MQYSVKSSLHSFILVLVAYCQGLPTTNLTSSTGPSWESTAAFSTKSTTFQSKSTVALKTTVPQSTSTVPPSTTTVPPPSTTIIPSTTTIPSTTVPSTTTLPPTTTTLPPTTPTTVATTTAAPTPRPIPKIRAILVNGRHPWEGRVELSLHGRPYGTVCDDGFNMNAANVACRMVGYKRAEQYFFGSSHFGRGRGSILLDEISCQGNEKNLLACYHHPIGVTDCSHSEDVGVRCVPEVRRIQEKEKKLKKFTFRLTGHSTPHPISEGVVEVLLSKKWRTICADEWDMQDARVLCGSLGFKEAVSVEPSPENKRMQRKKSMVLTKIACTGKESNVSECDRTFMKTHKECELKRAAEVRCERGSFVMDAAKAVQVPSEDTLQDSHMVQRPSIRLKAGARFGEGRLEVYHDGQWGTVCGDDFDKVSASVVCRQLGFGTASEVTSDATGYGQGIGPIWLWNVDCKGTESSIMECGHGQFNRSKCDHSMDVGISCNVPDLGVKDEIRLGSGRFKTEGRVEVKIDGRWGHVCGGDSWDMADSNVACRQLGLGFAQQPMKSTRYMGSTNLPILITDVNCTGTERSILECPHVLMTNATCTANYKAGILCAKRLPDVLIDVHVLQSSTYLQDWPRYLLQCAWEEGCLASTPDIRGTRRLLRFASAIMNRGTEEFRPVLSRHNWEWHSCHGHYHSMQVFSHYDLLDYEGERVAEGHKASFCLEDVYCDSGAEKVYNCNDGGDQGISVNCVDIYRNDIDCQWIDITGVETGAYILRVDVNPEQMVGETDYTNNEVVCDIYLSSSRVRISNCRYADDS